MGNEEIVITESIKMKKSSHEVEAANFVDRVLMPKAFFYNNGNTAIRDKVMFTSQKLNFEKSEEVCSEVVEADIRSKLENGVFTGSFSDEAEIVSLYTIIEKILQTSSIRIYKYSNGTIHLLLDIF